MIDIDEFKKNGFLHLKQPFCYEADKILREAIYLFQHTYGDTHQGWHYQDQIETNMKALFKEDFDRFVNWGKTCHGMFSLYNLGTSSTMEHILNRLGILGPIMSTRPVLFFNHPELAKKEVYHKTPPHQDWRSIQGSLDSVVCWIPLVDIPKELGAIEVIPGSHKRGLCTDRIEDNFGVCDVDESEFVSVETEAGDMLIFSTFLIHRSGNNVSDKIRWSVHYRYNNLYDKTFKERGFPSPYVYYPKNELITPDFPSVDQVKEAWDLE